MRIIFKVAGIFWAVALTGCANFNSIHRDNSLSRKDAEIVFTDAKQRAIIANPIAVKSKGLYTLKDGEPVLAEFENHLRLCSEAAPDVFSAYATSLAAKIAANIPEKTGEGAFSITSSETAATIARTQTINLFREQMFRTCERFLNGAIDGDELVVQAARDQRVMVSILAIEQLTGVYTPAVTALTSHATASTGGPTEESLKLVAKAKEASDKSAEAAKKADEDAKKAEAAVTEADRHGKANCAEVLADERLTDEQQAKCKAADDQRKEATQLAETANKDKAHYDQMSRLVDRLGGTAAGSGGAAEFSAAQVQAILSQNIEKVAGAVQNIVSETFLFDELEMTCVVTLRKAAKNISVNENLLNTCIAFLGAITELDINAAADLLDIFNATESRLTSNAKLVAACAFPGGGQPNRLGSIVKAAFPAGIPSGVRSIYADFQNQKSSDEVKSFLLAENPGVATKLAEGAKSLNCN